MLDLILLAAAEATLQEIYEKMEERESGRGDDFLEELDEALTQLRTFPRSGAAFHRNYRRLLIPGRRYGLIYSIEGNRVMVTRLVDLRQDPELVRRSLG